MKKPSPNISEERKQFLMDYAVKGLAIEMAYQEGYRNGLLSKEKKNEK